MRVSGLSKSNYYYRVKNKSLEGIYEDIKSKIKTIYRHHKGRYGYRRITLELRKCGHLINHKTVFKLMKTMGLKSVIRIKKYKSYQGVVGKKADNILNRDFYSSRPNQKWATDITEFKVNGEKLYLSPIIDLFNGEIICYNLSRRPNFKQIENMLGEAFKKKLVHTGLILHSDQGWQYQMKAYQRLLESQSVKQSMSRKGNCLDNAVIESFFGTIKSELFYLKKYSNIAELNKEIIDYISYYNNDRIKAHLNGMSPVKYRESLNYN